MAKKKRKTTHRKATLKQQYKSFRLEGRYSGQTLAICVVADLVIGFVLGFLLQPTIVEFFTAYAAV